MKNKTEHKRSCRKLDTLRDMVKVVNADAVMLGKISAQTEIVLRNDNLPGNESKAFEDNLNFLIKESSKPNNEIKKIKTTNIAGNSSELSSFKNKWQAVPYREILN